MQSLRYDTLHYPVLRGYSVRHKVYVHVRVFPDVLTPYLVLHHPCQQSQDRRVGRDPTFQLPTSRDLSFIPFLVNCVDCGQLLPHYPCP